MATKKTFEFKFEDRVMLRLSGEQGTVIGRAHYLRSNPSYLVEYLDTKGCQREEWFSEEAIAALGEPQQ